MENLFTKTLYSRTSTGAIQTWNMEQDGKGYRTNSGQLEGKIVTSDWTICKGKNIGRANETSPEDQASKEVAAKYKKKKEKGYFDNIDDVDNKPFTPMLAHKFKDHGKKIDWSKGVYVSGKMDGLRCVVNKNGAFSRTGKEFKSFPHIRLELQPLFDDSPNLILDGEIYNHEYKDNFDKIISLARKMKPTAEDIAESAEKLQFWGFDIPSCKESFDDRYRILCGTLQGFKSIRLCPHYFIDKKEKLEEYLAKFLEQGYEGLMINTVDGLYEQKRSYGLLKHKLFLDEEFEILDILEGEGNRSGMFGKAVCRAKNGESFEANARGNFELYQEVLKNKDYYIGKLATVRYQNLTPNGKPRFGVILDLDRID